jgi:hypothetical protein
VIASGRLRSRRDVSFLRYRSLILYSEDAAQEIKILADPDPLSAVGCRLDVGCVTRTLQDCRVIFSGDVASTDVSPRCVAGCG